MPHNGSGAKGRPSWWSAAIALGGLGAAAATGFFLWRQRSTVGRSEPDHSTDTRTHGEVNTGTGTLEVRMGMGGGQEASRPPLGQRQISGLLETAPIQCCQSFEVESQPTEDELEPLAPSFAFKTFDVLCAEEEKEVETIVDRLASLLKDYTAGQGQEEEKEEGTGAVPPADASDPPLTTSQDASDIQFNLKSSAEAWIGKVLGEAMDLKEKEVSRVLGQEVELWSISQQQHTPAVSVVGSGGSGEDEHVTNLEWAESLIASLSLSTVVGRGHCLKGLNALCHCCGNYVSALASSCSSTSDNRGTDATTTASRCAPWVHWTPSVCFLVAKSLLAGDPSTHGTPERKQTSFLLLLRCLGLLIRAEGSSLCRTDDSSHEAFPSYSSYGFYHPSSLPLKPIPPYLGEAWFYLGTLISTLDSAAVEGFIDVALREGTTATTSSTSTGGEEGGSSDTDTPPPKAPMDVDTLKKLLGVPHTQHLDSNEFDALVERCYTNALHSTLGNHGGSWNSLAGLLALRGHTEDQSGADKLQIPLFGRAYTETDCYLEAIRCFGGFEGCHGFHPQHGELWMNLALAYEPNSTDTMAVPRKRASHAMFTHAVVSGRLSLVSLVALDRKQCFAKALGSPEAQEQAVWWSELGKTLRIDFTSSVQDCSETQSASDDPASDTLRRIVYRVVEERINVVKSADADGSGVMPVGRMSCFQRAILLEPESIELWFRLALSMEDEGTVQCNVEKQKLLLAEELLLHTSGSGEAEVDAEALEKIHHRIDVVIDPSVYERTLMVPAAGSGDAEEGSGIAPLSLGRVEALLWCLKRQPRDPKVWFSVGTTLAERCKAQDALFDTLLGVIGAGTPPSIDTESTQTTTFNEQFRQQHRVSTKISIPRDMLPPNFMSSLEPDQQEAKKEGEGDEQQEGQGEEKVETKPNDFIVLSAAQLLVVACEYSRGRYVGMVVQWCRNNGVPIPPEILDGQ